MKALKVIAKFIGAIFVTAGMLAAFYGINSFLNGSGIIHQEESLADQMEAEGF